MTVIKILVAGLAALVPGGKGEMTVLLPKVETSHYCPKICSETCCCIEDGPLSPRAISVVRHIPDHHAFLGYEGAHGTWTGAGSPECADIDDDPRLETILCWIRLDGATVNVINGRTGGVKDDPPGRITMLRTMPTSVTNLPGFSWLAEMDRVSGVDGEVSEDCWDGAPDCQLSGRVVFQYNGRRSCRLSDSYGDATRARVRELVFKAEAAAPDIGAPKQALAEASLFETNIVGRDAYIEIRSEGYDGLLVLTPNGDGVVHIILGQYIPDEAAKQYRKWTEERCFEPGLKTGHDSHFHAYYELLAERPLERAIPFAHDDKLIDNDWIKNACDFPYLETPGGDAELRYDPDVAPVSAAPPGHECALSLAGPPLCPQAVFEKPD